MERQITTMGGNVITLEGHEIRVGERAPDFYVLDNDLMPKTLDNYTGRIKLISAVPSLDTRICDLQTKKFNELARDISGDVVILTISMDLPFAQKRWRQETRVERIEILSDHRDASFGLNYGILIRELRLLNRAIFIIDKTDIVRYIEIVGENHNHPNYKEAIKALQSI